MNQNHVKIVIFLIIVLVPTPHSRTRQENKRTVNCHSSPFQDGDFIGTFFDLQGWHKIEIDIESNEEVQIRLKDETGTFYSSTKKVHDFIGYRRSDAYYNITIINPTSIGNGSTAIVSGTIVAYEIVEYTEWLPWWIASARAFLINLIDLVKPPKTASFLANPSTREGKSQAEIGRHLGVQRQGINEALRIIDSKLSQALRGTAHSNKLEIHRVDTVNGIL